MMGIGAMSDRQSSASAIGSAHATRPSPRSRTTLPSDTAGGNRKAPAEQAIPVVEHSGQGAHLKRRTSRLPLNFVTGCLNFATPDEAPIVKYATGARHFPNTLGSNRPIVTLVDEGPPRSQVPGGPFFGQMGEPAMLGNPQTPNSAS